MRVLVQKTNYASVEICDKIHNHIDFGFVIFVGFTHGDNKEKIDYMVNKVLNLRIFEDENNVMNKSILDVGGQILSISQFTLYANTKKGNRPSYIEALNGSEASILYDLFNEKLSKYIDVKTGVFGSDMLINISNIGPTTIMLEK